MWMKAYLALLAVGVIITGFFVYYAWSWTGSIGDPRIALAGYDYHRNLAISTLVAFTIILMVAGNVVLWSTRSAKALWITLVYFIIAIAAIFVFLTKAADLVVDSVAASDRIGHHGGIFLTVIGAVALGAIIFFDQLIVIRLREKMFGKEGQAEKENSRLEEAES